MSGVRHGSRASARASAKPRDWAGLLLVDKPAGPTSHDLVARARRRLGVGGIGHLGTLDPAATGLLVLAIGAATRCAAVWQGGAKTYAGTARFGVVTDTQDLAGRVLESRPPAFDEPALRRATLGFTGALLQRPPMVSAVHVDGQRLHELARRGIEVEREPRPIEVAEWRWTSLALPEHAEFEVRCSGGTYVRTLVHDLGAALGCGAALASLRRLRSEPFGLERAAPWEAVESGDPGELLERWGLPLDRALETLPGVVLEERDAATLGHGGRPRLAPVPGVPVDAGERSVVFRDAAGRALALGELRTEGEGWLACPRVVFAWAVREGAA